MLPPKKYLHIFVTPLLLTALCFFFAPSHSYAAGPQSATVSATVLPTAENTKQKHQKNFFEKMDPVEQLTVGSGVGLGVIVIGGGLFYTLQHRKKKSLSSRT